MEKLDKRLILNTMVTEKQEGRDTLLISVFAKDYQNKDNREYDIYHLLKTQIKFLTDFNSRRSDTIGDLRMHIYIYIIILVNLTFVWVICSVGFLQTEPELYPDSIWNWI